MFLTYRSQRKKIKLVTKYLYLTDFLNPVSQNNTSCRKHIFLLEEKRSPEKQNSPTSSSWPVIALLTLGDPACSPQAPRGPGELAQHQTVLLSVCETDWPAPIQEPRREQGFRSSTHGSLPRAVSIGLMSTEHNKKGKNRTPTLAIQKFYFKYSTSCISGHSYSYCNANKHGLACLRPPS